MGLLNTISACFVLIGLVSAGLIGADLLRHPQPMRIMNAVWVLTGLWAGGFALLAYYSFGRAKGMERGTGGMPDMHDMAAMSGSAVMGRDGAEKRKSTHKEMKMKMAPARYGWQSSVLSTLHCGAGCTVADLVGEWFAFFVPVAIGGSLLAGSWVLDYLLALVFGIFFQYAAIRGMQKLSRGTALARAAKADFLSLTAWQAGMYAWMALVYFVLTDHASVSKASWTFWFMMQVAMCAGFLCSWPVNVLLVRLGIKKAM